MGAREGLHAYVKGTLRFCRVMAAPPSVGAFSRPSRSTRNCTQPLRSQQGHAERAGQAEWGGRRSSTRGSQGEGWGAAYLLHNVGHARVDEGLRGKVGEAVAQRAGAPLVAGVREGVRVGPRGTARTPTLSGLGARQRQRQGGPPEQGMPKDTSSSTARAAGEGGRGMAGCRCGAGGSGLPPGHGEHDVERDAQLLCTVDVPWNTRGTVTRSERARGTGDGGSGEKLRGQVGEGRRQVAMRLGLTALRSSSLMKASHMPRAHNTWSWTRESDGLSRRTQTNGQCLVVTSQKQGEAHIVVRSPSSLTTPYRLGLYSPLEGLRLQHTLMVYS